MLLPQTGEAESEGLNVAQSAGIGIGVATICMIALCAVIILVVCVVFPRRGTQSKNHNK